MTLVKNALWEKYQLQPTHTPEEMMLLAGRFPDEIKLFTVHKDKTMLGGAIIYESSQVAHAQYSAAGKEGKASGALDLLWSYLITDYYAKKKYFDFGISTEKESRYLNTGLSENKERYGARTVVYDFYEWDVGEAPR